MVNNDVRHKLNFFTECAHVIPITEPGINFGVVDWIEARIGAINRHEEREYMHAAENALQRAAEEHFQLLEVAGQPIGVSN